MKLNLTLNKFISKILIALKIKKRIKWKYPDAFLLEDAYSKIFKPTVNCLNQIAKGGNFQVTLKFTDLQGVSHSKQFNITLFCDNQIGIGFKIELPYYLNVGSVNYKESYGLSKELHIADSNITFFVPEDSVFAFETKFPQTPQFLHGRFNKFKSATEAPPNSFFRLVIPIKDKEMIFPTSILDYADNHMKFDISSWDRQSSLLGIPMISTHGMYASLSIKGFKFHFYSIEQLNVQVIDSLDKISEALFKEISYAIRLCFAFLSGKFYKDEKILFSSPSADFSKIDYFNFECEQPSIITGNQIVNPTFFFSQFSAQKPAIQEQWKDFHKMFDTNIFSKMCEKILESSELSRTLELILTAGSIDDPVQKGALYSVSIETFTEFFKSENENSFKPITDGTTWNTFHSSLRACLNNIQGAIPPNGFNILLSKINNLNSPTNRDKLEQPFRMLGIPLSAPELEILNHRNSYLHGGQPDNKDWHTMTNLNALKLHYLIGKLLLKYFGYSGHYINLAGWYLLHDSDTKKIMEKIDWAEITDLIQKINSNKIKSLKQIEYAKKVIANVQKFTLASIEFEDLIKII